MQYAIILGSYAVQFEEYWIFNVSAKLSRLSYYRTDENTFSVFSTSNVIFLSWNKWKFFHFIFDPLLTFSINYLCESFLFFSKSLFDPINTFSITSNQTMIPLYKKFMRH